MESITAIIVDDEQSARDILANLLQRFCPQIKVISSYSNVEDAAQGIKEHRPQVVFLDIEMPNYAGYEIIRFFDEIDFEIIFITAYDKYAIRAFEVSAIDYLLKPIEIDRLKEAVLRLSEKLTVKTESKQYQLLSQTLKEKKVKNISINVSGYQKIVEIDSIIAIEAHESYSMIHTLSDAYMVSKNLKHFESLLGESDTFFRTHKSWMINLSHMISYSKSKLEVKMAHNLTAKLSKYRKSDFEDQLS